MKVDMYKKQRKTIRQVSLQTCNASVNIRKYKAISGVCPKDGAVSTATLIFFFPLMADSVGATEASETGLLLLTLLSWAKRATMRSH